MKNAIVLLSGGLDSSTMLAIVKEKGYNPYCISFDYGQKHKIELERATELVDYINGQVIVDEVAFGELAVGVRQVAAREKLTLLELLQDFLQNKKFE